MRRTPALIVGGGPAGTAAAIVLARAGSPVLLLERRREPDDALCGGFLSWRTLETLATLGVDREGLNSVRIDRVRIVAGDTVREAALPCPGVAVSRRRLDTVMLAAAATAGTPIERGVGVRRAAPGIVHLGDGGTIETPTLLLATGKSDLRGLARPAEARGRDPTLGLRVRYMPAPAVARALAGVVELHPFRGGYAGLAVQEDGTVNCCLAVHRARLQAAGDPAALLAALARELPTFAGRLDGLIADTPIDAIANVPYGWRATEGRDGLYRLGDQAGVIPSLAGEGIGIAVATGTSAATAILAGEPAAAWQRRMARCLASPIRFAGTVRALAEGRAAPLLLPLMPPSLIQFIARATRVTR